MLSGFDMYLLVFHVVYECPLRKERRAKSWCILVSVLRYRSIMLLPVSTSQLLSHVCPWGSFFNYVDKILAFFDHLPPALTFSTHTDILPDWTLKKWGLSNFAFKHCYLVIHRHPMQKEFLKSCEGFLRAALTVHGHPGHVWKIAKMALFDPCMEFQKILG